MNEETVMMNIDEWEALNVAIKKLRWIKKTAEDEFASVNITGDEASVLLSVIKPNALKGCDDVNGVSCLQKRKRNKDESVCDGEGSVEA